MIDWFNTNQGFVISILTAVYVIATIVMSWLMVSANRLSAKSIEQTARIYQQQSRPVVAFDIVYRSVDRGIYFEITNLGASAAYKVVIRLNQTVTSIGGRQSALLSNPVGMLLPKRTVSDFIDVGHQFHVNNPLEFSGEITYQDAEGQAFSEPIALDLRYYREIMATETHDVGRELRDIKEELRNLRCR